MRLLIWYKYGDLYDRSRLKIRNQFYAIYRTIRTANNILIRTLILLFVQVLNKVCILGGVFTCKQYFDKNSKVCLSSKQLFAVFMNVARFLNFTLFSRSFLECWRHHFNWGSLSLTAFNTSNWDMRRITIYFTLNWNMLILLSTIV